MKITRQSMITGEVHTLDLPISKKDLLAYMGGVSLENAFAELSCEQRAFMVTGIVVHEVEPIPCFGKFERIDENHYEGLLDLAALKKFAYKLDRMPCKIVPQDDEIPESVDYGYDPWDSVKLIYDGD